MATKTLISGGKAVKAGRSAKSARSSRSKASAETPSPAKSASGSTLSGRAVARWDGDGGAPGKGLWLTVAELALGLDVTGANIRQNIEPSLDAAAFWEGHPRRIRLRAVVDMLEQRAAERATARRRGPAPLGQVDISPTLALAGGAGGATQPVGPSPDADLEAGPPTEALERMRLLRGDLLELEKKRLLGELLTRSEVEESLAAVRQTLRGMADTLSRSHPGAAEIVADALAELVRATPAEEQGNREDAKAQRTEETNA